MGMMIEGRWSDEDLSGFVRDGQQVRFSSGFHNSIKADGSGDFPAEANRYALYLNRTCPWSHRAAVTRVLKGLESVVDEVLLEPAMGMQSWWFGESGEYRDPAMSATHLHQLYAASDSNFTGRVSVPILWDKKTSQIVNNDSGAIARLLNSEFNHYATAPQTDFFPSALASEIDQLNEFIGDRTTDGVYRCLLAKSQGDYEQAFDQLFDALDTLDSRLANQRFLLGQQITEPDWRLFACLVRFDAVYYPLYKCNRQRIVDFANLWDYTRDLYQTPGVASTVDLERIKQGYYGIVHRGGIVPKGPLLDFSAPHNRQQL